MQKISKERRIFILAILISLLIHFVILFLLFTYKSDHQLLFPFTKKDDLRVIKIIEEEPPLEEEDQQSQKKLSINQSMQPQRQSQTYPDLYNPQSNKEAETLEGESITDDTTTEEGAAAIIESATPDETTQAPEFSTEEPAPGLLYEKAMVSSEPIDSIQNDTGVELTSDPGAGDSDREEEDETNQEDDEFQQDDKSMAQQLSSDEEILTVKKPDARKSLPPLRPSREYREKARKKLANFARAFSEQYDQVQEARRSENTTAGRVRRQQTELQTMSYRQKIDQAIHASAFRHGTVYSDIDISQFIEADITFNREGKIVNFVMKKRTLSPVINNYLKTIVYNADFPQLPKGLNIDSFTYTWSPHIKIKKGINELGYFYR